MQLKMIVNWSTLFLLLVSRLLSPTDCQPTDTAEDILRQDLPCNVTERASVEIKPCQFPFIYKNETFFGCTSNHDEDQLPWCSTQTDPITNEHIDKSGYWGHCPDTCPTEHEGQEAEDLLLSLTLKPRSLGTRTSGFSSDCSSTCRLYSSCRWSRDALRSVSRLPRAHPVRQSLINFIRRRVCNSKKQSVFCCQSGDAPDVVEFPSSTDDGASKNSASWKPDGDKDECGKALVPTNIIGGENAKLGELPYNALLGFILSPTGGKANSTYYICGASVLNKWYVLTAAHCLFEEDGSLKKPSEISLGENEVGPDPDCAFQGCLEPVIKRKVDRIITHEGYNPRQLDSEHDIALIKVNQPIPLHGDEKSNVIPICLPWKGQDRDLRGRSLLVSGWGRTTNNPLISRQDFLNYQVSSKNLKKVKLDLTNPSECTNARHYNNFQPQLQLCVGSRDGNKDSCNGDSGGPLVTRLGPNEPWYQVGIVSYGITPCATDVPAVYTKVSQYLDWIEGNLK